MGLLHVRVEALSYLADIFGRKPSERLVLERTIPPDCTLEGLIRALAAEYPGFARLCLNGPDLVMENYMIVVGGMMMEFAGGWQRPLADGEEILLLPAFSGGSG